MSLRNFNLKELHKRKKVILPLCLIGIFLLHTTFVFGQKDKANAAGVLPSSASDQHELSAAETMPEEKESVRSKSPEVPRKHTLKRIPVLTLRDKAVLDVCLGYGMHITLELPEKIKAVIPPDENLVSVDYLDNRTILKGIAYAVGEITNVTIITESEKTIDVLIRIVEPAESDLAFKFIVPSKEIFSESHVKKEVQKATEKREGELEKREANLKEVTEELAEDKLKEKLLHEETGAKRVHEKEDGLEMKDLQVTKLGGRVYLKFTLRNRSKEDFQVASLMLGRAVTDPKNSDKVLGVEDLETDTPTFESALIPAGGETKVLVAFDAHQVRNTEKVVLKVVEEGGLGRAVEFKNLKLFTR